MRSGSSGTRLVPSLEDGVLRSQLQSRGLVLDVLHHPGLPKRRSCVLWIPLVQWKGPVPHPSPWKQTGATAALNVHAALGHLRTRVPSEGSGSWVRVRGCQVCTEMVLTRGCAQHFLGAPESSSPLKTGFSLLVCSLNRYLCTVISLKAGIYG